MSNIEITQPEEISVIISPQDAIEVVIAPAESIEVSIAPGSATYRPIRTTRRGFIAAEPLSALRMVVLNANGTVQYASASNQNHANRVRGLTVDAALTGESVEIIEEGPYTDTSWDWGLNQPVFLGENGNLTVNPASDSGFFLQVGQSETPDTLYVSIQRPILL